MRLGIPKPDVHTTEQQREYVKLGLLAVLIGVIAGIVAVLFRLGILWMYENLFLDLGDALSGMGRASYALIPALGGLFVGPLVYYFAREAKGHGVPEVMDAVIQRGGRLRLRLVVVKALASAITIGSGGSAGREGPIVQMGSTIGSNIAQALKMTPAQTKILLGCGAAGGIAATFNTPIAGVLFAIELILMEFKTRSFIPLVISSVIATLVAPGFDAWITDSWEGNPWLANPAFDVPANIYKLGSPGELAAFLLLGIICGLVALLYIKSLYKFEDIFDALRMPPWAKPALGGLLLGGLGIALFWVHGIGYDTITDVIDGSWPATFNGIALLAVLALAKILAVSLTLGSGGSGGIFAPALFIGCMVGGAFGGFIHHFFPSNTAVIGAYALVAMAALVAASTRGTLTAILMIFEMTRIYDIIIPLLFACVIADMVASLGSPETIYTKKLLRRGVKIVQDLEPNVMQLFSVKDIMVPLEEVVTINPGDELHKVVAIIRRTGHNGFPIVDDDGRLVGVVTHEDTRNAHNRGELFLKASELMTTDMLTVTPYETGEMALRRMGDRRISHLPVVDPYDPTKLMGWLSKGDVVFAYEDYHRRMEAPFSDESGVSEDVEGPPGEPLRPEPLLRRIFGRRGRREVEEVEEEAPAQEEEEAVEGEGEEEVVDVVEVPASKLKRL